MAPSIFFRSIKNRKVEKNKNSNLSPKKHQMEEVYPYSTDRQGILQFFHNDALAIILSHDIIIAGQCRDGSSNNWSMNVLCGDTFAYSCADLQPISFHELQSLYDMRVKDPINGPTVWCIKKRQEYPIKPVYDAIQNGGIWDLDALGYKRRHV